MEAKKKKTIAVASGKGGTGKTTIAVNLALTCPSSVELLDCDVEEPNDHLFLQPVWSGRERSSVLIPEVEVSRCNLCGLCRAACRFNAVMILGEKPLFFPELCHSCGACVAACPNGALTEAPREIGTIARGDAQGLGRTIQFISGTLDVGEAKSPPLIEAVRACSGAAEVSLIDAPPGSSCPVIASVIGADYLILVTEPTPFGLNDFIIAVEMARKLSLPFGAVINRADLGDDSVEAYCAREKIPVLARLPFDRAVAECYSRGENAVEALPEYRGRFEELWRKIERAFP